MGWGAQGGWKCQGDLDRAVIGLRVCAGAQRVGGGDIIYLCHSLVLVWGSWNLACRVLKTLDVWYGTNTN